MSLRDISIILRKNHARHCIAVTHNVDIDDDDGNNNNNKPLNQKATQAYKLFSEGKKLSDVAIEKKKEASY
jgi:hypothetical protein